MVIESLEIIGDALVIEFRDFAREHESSGSLYKSIKYNIKEKSLELSMNKYAVYVDEGTQPHPVSPDKLRKWARKRGLNEYAVAANIKKFGTKAHPFMYKFEEVIKEKLNKFAKEYAKEMTAYVVNEFKKEIKNIK